MKHEATEIVYLGTRKKLSLARSRDAVEILGFAAVFFPVILMVAGGGFTGIENAQDLWGAVNRLSALIGTSMLLVHTALVSRAPWIEKVMGLDKMTSAHKRLGKPVLYLLLLHTVSVSFEYAGDLEASAVSAFIYLVSNFEEVLLATIGLGLMILVVMTSIRISRKKLSYEAWYLVHLSAYGAILLSIPHQFELGTDFLAQPLLTSYFTLLYLLVAGNLIWFRILQPIVLSFANNLRVSKVAPEAHRTTSITVSGKRIAALGAEAGQFFLLRVLTAKQWWRPHPFSVSKSPSDEIRFTIGNRGDDTALLQDIAEGTRVILEGPYGVFSESKRSRRYVTLIAAGIGVAPIRALAESLAAEPGDVTVLYRVTGEGQAALLSEVERICNERGHNLRVLRGPRGAGDSFLPDDPQSGFTKPEYARLLELAPMLLESDVYICGPSGWSKLVRGAVQRLGGKSEQIHLEEFAW